MGLKKELILTNNLLIGIIYILGLMFMENNLMMTMAYKYPYNLIGIITISIAILIFIAITCSMLYQQRKKFKIAKDEE